MDDCCRTYLPSQVSRVVGLWRESLTKVSEKAGQSLADPKDYENLFPGLADALKTEQYLGPERRSLLPASAYTNIPVTIFAVYLLVDILTLGRIYLYHYLSQGSNGGIKLSLR